MEGPTGEGRALLADIALCGRDLDRGMAAGEVGLGGNECFDVHLDLASFLPVKVEEDAQADQQEGNGSGHATGDPSNRRVPGGSRRWGGSCCVYVRDILVVDLRVAVAPAIWKG